jgi:CubicO group peptidase (beta-lactamase class C family)
MIDTLSARSQVQEFIDGALKESSVPGFLAGVWCDGETFEVAAGTANLNTGAPMTTDSAFLTGSITKVWVTSMLMRFLERGQVRLDDRVIDYLPDLELGDSAALESLRVVNLVNHSSGIDAADFCPELGRGTDVVRRYVELLAGKGQLYPVGEHISYCNAAFVILGRLLEVLTGDDFHTILRREIFEPLGLERTCASGDDAILHRTVVGHIVDPETDVPRTTRRFMLPYSMAPAGTTLITTIGEQLRFGRVHLDGGMTPEGKRVLAAESVAAMSTATIREEQLGGFGFGLGWMLPPYGPTKVMMHAGGSYGGQAWLIVVPELRFIYAAFANSTTAGPVHERVQDFVLQEIAGLAAPESFEASAEAIDPARYTGTFRKQFQTAVIEENESGGLVEKRTLEYDHDHRVLMSEYIGRSELPPVPLRQVTPTLFVPGTAEEKPVPLSRAWTAGVTFLDPDQGGRYAYISEGLRVARRVD